MNTLDIINSGRSHKLTVLILAWPIFIEQLLVSLTQVADSAMVGSLGAVATAAVAINYGANMLINQIFFAFGVAFTSLIARSIGAGETERARHITQQAVTLTFIVGTILSILCYVLARAIPIWMGGEEEIIADAEIYNKILALSLLFRGFTMTFTAIYRGYGDTKTPMLINVICNVLNVIGNYFMIYPTRIVTLFGHEVEMFGFGWGVAGAAISTSISGVLGGIAIMAIIMIRKNEMRLRINRGIVPDAPEMGRIFRLATPAMFERLVISSAFIIVGRVIASLGTAAVAANNLAGTAESISFMPGFAFGAAATTIFGQCIGADEEKLGKRYITETLQIGLISMIVMTLVLWFGSGPIMRFFTPDEEVVEMGSVLLKILAVIQIPQMAASVYSGALNGAGDSTSPFYISLLSMWGVRIFGAILCVHVFGLGLYAVCVCTCLDNVVRYVLFYLTYRSDHWKKRAQQF